MTHHATLERGGAASTRCHVEPARRDRSRPAPSLAAGSAGTVGELVFDGARWWLCLASGAPGSWREVAGPAATGTLHLLESPVRAYDSRPGHAPTGVTKGKLEQDRERVIDLRAARLPADAHAVLIELTVHGPSPEGGFVKVFEPGAAVPVVSAITWSTGGHDVARTATVRVPTSGRLSLRCGGAAASTDVDVDVADYYL